ncbi:MAG: ornithine cyclodeaminase family protein [Longimicrobiales bacterium]
MKLIEAAQVHQALDFPALVEALRQAFGGPAGTPRRMVFRLDEEDATHDAFALLPSWNDEVIGVKAFTYLPGNAARGRQVLHSKILLFDRVTGEPLAVMDGTSVTYWRTAAVAALAADHLARRDARRLLFCGTGNLAPYMVLAHAAVRPIAEVDLWGRDRDKAERTARLLHEKRPALTVRVVDDLEAAAGEADIISCATGSHDPIVLGEWVGAGTHTDFFGNHERTGRECDTDLVVKSRVFVDSRANVLNEAGDILIPIDEGRIDEGAIIGELSELCSGRVAGRGSDEEITLFKSVGTALSDLAAARLVARRQGSEGEAGFSRAAQPSTT